MPSVNQKLDDAIAKIISGFTDLKEALRTNDTEALPKIRKPEAVSSSVTRLSPPKAVPVPQVPTQALPTAISPKDELNDFESLKEALMSDRWPEAVNSSFICDPDSESDKIERGKGIIDLMVEEDLKNMRFLDFGCGDGHCASLSTEQNTMMSVGYDIKEKANWNRFEKKPNLLLTKDFNNVINNGPYDVIVLFDVIDHIEKEDPVVLLRKVEKVLKPGGKVYARCHPFTSRHATHLYHQLNKAYVHLIFSPDEIRKLVPTPKHEESNAGIVFPMKTYSDYFAQAGLTIVSKRDITEKVETFFKIPRIAQKIMQTTRTDQFPEFQLGLQFIDYVLTK